MMDSLPCYFCGKEMLPNNDIVGLKCLHHLDGIQVHHYYNKFTQDLSKIYWFIKREEYNYGFSLRFIPQTTTISLIHQDRFLAPENIIRLDCIPDNLTPETAQEKLSFYLTYM